MKPAVLTIALLAAIVVYGRSISVADDGAQPAPVAAPAENQKANPSGGGCMPDGSCCGNGACAQAGSAEKSAGGGTAGGCPCGKMKQAEKKPSEG